MTSPTSPKADEIASLILNIIGSAESGQIRGTDLAQEIRQEFDWFQPTLFGCMNMREFIEKHVPSVCVIGKSGMDNVYGARGTASLAALPNALAPTGDDDEDSVRMDLDVWWKTFASPNKYYTLVANKETGERRSLQQGDTVPGDPWVTVPRCTLAFFDAVSREFVSTLSDDYEKGVLLNGIRTGTGPNSEFYQSIVKLKLEGPWNEFRRRRIIQHFISTLKELAVPLAPPPRNLLPEREVDPRPSLPPNYTNSAATRFHRVQSPSGRSLSRDEKLRRIVQGAVSKLSTRDLRNLHLPLGDVLDALDEL